MRVEGKVSDSTLNMASSALNFSSLRTSCSYMMWAGRFILSGEEEPPSNVGLSLQRV